MKHKIKIAIVIMSALMTSSPTRAGPFGLSQGMTLSQLKVIKQLKPNQYEILVPSPNPEFESYHVLLTPEDGLCKITAIGRDHSNDRSGSDAQQTYDRLKTVLQEKYGVGNALEFLKSGALWTSSSEWVMSIKQKERYHDTFWLAGKAGVKLPGELHAIKLSVSAVSGDTAYITVGYEFQNSDRCIDRIRAADDSSL